MSRLPLVIAHRGDSRHAPENTIAAISRAIEAGADGVEIDLRLSLDGVPVVIHDADLLRTAGVRAKVSEMTLAELAATDVGSWFNTRFPRHFDRTFAGQTVPLLDDVLELLSDFDGWLYLELKCDGRSREQLIQAVGKRIRSLPLLPRIIVQSFDLEAVAIVKKLLPQVQTAALFGPEVRHMFKRRRRLIEIAQRMGIDQLSVHRSLVTTGLMRAANAASLPFTVWTVDDPRWLDRAHRMGIRAIITNKPAKMMAERDKHT